MRYNLESVNAIGDLQQMYRWSMTFTSGPASSAAGDLAIRCKSANMPVKTQEVLEESLHGHIIKRPGKTTVAGEITFTFVEDITGTITKTFRDWEEKLWASDSGAYGGKQELAEQVRSNITIELLGPDDAVTQTFELKDAYLSSFEPGGEFGGDGAMNPVATLSYQSFTWTGQ